MEKNHFIILINQIILVFKDPITHAYIKQIIRIKLVNIRIQTSGCLVILTQIHVPKIL